MSNGDKIIKMFPNAKIKFTRNLSGMRFVEVDFNDNVYEGLGTSSVHTFSREWWDSEE